MNAQTNPDLITDIDALLDGTLDDLADAPEFKPFPPGLHHVTCTLVRKKVGKNDCFELGLKAIETKELASAEDTPLKAGDESSVLFNLTNEYGQGDFKKLMSAAAAQFGAKKIAELVADVQNADALVLTKLQSNKEKTATYLKITEISFDV